jgi:hypothetical protein
MSASQPTRLHTDAVMEVSSGSEACGSIAVPRTAGIGAERKLTKGIICFRFCPFAVIGRQHLNRLKRVETRLFVGAA